MNNSEALELLELILNNHSIMLEVNDNRMECLNTIKQELERLEVLEKQMGRNAEIHTEVLLKNNKLRQENEKLKKVIEILKQYISLDLECNIFHEIRMGREMIVIPQQEYELLKEVLDNE